MILERKIVDGKVEFTHSSGSILRTHEETLDCYDYGCVVHFPSHQRLSEAPYNWREDTGVMERICPHGVGHPDLDSANHYLRLGMGYMNVHGCDGCCRENGEA